MSRLPAEKPSPGALTGILTGELAGPVPEAVRQVAAEIRRRHAAGVDAVLFYGSCLRTGITADRVLDFYVLVRSYRATYAYRWLRALNAALPPNVFYVEVGRGPDVLRAKYAVISTADFVRAASPRSLAPIVWARFCQPARLVYARDATVREAVVQAARQAVLTFVGGAMPLLDDASRPFRPADVWQTGFRETYRTEWRAERPDAIRALYAADPERYDRVARLGLHELAATDGFTFHEQAGRWMVNVPQRTRVAARTRWRRRVVLAKTLYALRLLKTAFTFDDWLSYVVWKLGRHSGVRVELTERQRRWPLVWGWPALVRLLRRRVLR